MGDERLLLALDNQDLPEWWIPGKHDRDLLFGVAKHGIIRMEFHILNDQELSFQDIMKRHLSGESMIDANEKKLYAEMRENAAAARKELEKEDGNEDIKEAKEEKEEKMDDVESDVVKETKTEKSNEKLDTVPKQEIGDSEEKDDDVKEEKQDEKENNDESKTIEAMETDPKDVTKEEEDE